MVTTHIRSIGRAAVVTLLGVSLVLVAAPAQAGKRGRRGKRAAKAEEAKKQAAVRRAEVLFGEGAALYKAKRYRQAIVKFEAAYAAYPEPNLLYNLGRCYEAIGQLKRAKLFFERFIKDPAANPAVRKKAETHLEMLRSIEAQVGKAQEPASMPATPPPPVATRPASRPAPPPPPPRRGFARIGKWLFAGLGLAAAGVGTAFFVAGAGDHGDLQDARDEAGAGGVAGLTQREASALSDDGKLKKTVGIIAWAAAAACLAGSAIFWVLDGGTKERAPRQTALAPWVGSGSAGAVLVGTF